MTVSDKVIRFQFIRFSDYNGFGGALKGHYIPTQANALGLQEKSAFRAQILVGAITQGVALIVIHIYC